ncbi:ImmA/IrrE family metallo-endopeptidase [Variovorax sp. RB2P76]|uniref:ImmA/IrrE family metallo-endopeptidase n=1 Tax=Variovorax sp. RB2P76 TaxID=3443736 RepID=UPI003F45ECFC
MQFARVSALLPKLGYPRQRHCAQRIEIQANYLASCILMPRERFRKAFYEQLQIRSVQNKGFGPLFVDTQECNLSNYYGVTARLIMRFGASRAAATIRLAGMGLITDARKNQNSAPRMEAPDRLIEVATGRD